MDILRNLQRLESRLTRTVDEAARKVTQPGGREPLEVLHAIVASAEQRIEPAGRGRYVFPFNQINISVAADTHETRARYEAVFESEPPLQARIVERLEGAGCKLTDLNIITTYVNSAEANWTAPEFHVDFARLSDRVKPGSELDAEHDSLTLTVIQGTAGCAEYVFTASRINLGRCAEVRDSRGRLIRTNHVAFSESSVSRNHAHIECGPAPGEYRLYDDRSAQGTSILRNGATIPVPPGSRGVRLRSGDEIALEDVRLRVNIAPG